ncbi:MAG: nitroreductase family protein [Deltaproteobacteria bacterium]|nr:nitroreductase family protein [Deltaproteobacteria bacterium]
MVSDFFSVDASLCRKDGICVQVCPVRIIRAGTGELPVMDERLRNRCIGCGQCMAFCPTRACVAPGFSREDVRPLDPASHPTPEQMEELVFARRSIRNFKDKPVPEETLVRVLDAVRYAPTGNNRQAFRWIVTKNRERSRALLELVIGWLRRLPETDPGMAARLHSAGVVRGWDKGTDILSREAPHIVVPGGDGIFLDILDGIIGLSYYEMIAQAHGIGCCWSGYLTRAFDHPDAAEVRDFLGLEAGEAAFSALMVGFPRFKTVSRPPRKPLRLTWR